jgi:hypothetical protein
LAVPLRADLAPRSKRRLCWAKASRNGERHGVGKSLVTAYEVSMLPAAVAGAGRCFGW